MGGLRQVSVFGPGITMMSCEWMNECCSRVNLCHIQASVWTSVWTLSQGENQRSRRRSLPVHPAASGLYPARAAEERHEVSSSVNKQLVHTWRCWIQAVAIICGARVILHSCTESSPQVHCSHQESLITVFYSVFTFCLLLQLYPVFQSRRICQGEFSPLFLVHSGPLWRPTWAPHTTCLTWVSPSLIMTLILSSGEWKAAL